MFAPFQAEVSDLTQKKIDNGDENRRRVTKLWLLWETTYQLWTSPKYKALTKKAFYRLGKILNKAIEKKGDKTYM